MIAKIPALDFQTASIQTIDVGQLAIGPITVGDLVLSNADVSMSAAQAVLKKVRVRIRINVSIEWHVHVGMPDWIPDIDVGDTYDLGTITVGPLDVGDIVIPGLNDIHMHIPTLTGQNTSAAVNPLGLKLDNATADQIHATNLSLPSAGFSIIGLSLNSLQGSNVKVPAAKADNFTVAHLRGDVVHIPSLTISGLHLPAAQLPSLSSSAPVDIPANLATASTGFDAGILRLVVHLTPSAFSHIEQIEITNGNADATIGQVVLHNLSLPYDVLNLTLSQVGINTIAIPSFDVS